MGSSPQPIKPMSEVLAEELAVIDEMKYSGILIARILFLEGKPIVSELKQIHLGEDLIRVFQNGQDISSDDNDGCFSVARFISEANANITVLERDLDTINRAVMKG